MIINLPRLEFKSIKKTYFAILFTKTYYKNTMIDLDPKKNPDIFVMHGNTLVFLENT